MASGLSYLDHRFGFFVFSLYLTFVFNLEVAELAIQIIHIFIFKVLLWYQNSYPPSHREYSFNV